MKRIITVALAIIGSMATAIAQQRSASDLGARTIERRAVEAVIWGMPAVNYDLMLQEMLSKTGGKVNQIVYWGRPLDWHNQTLTPNPDAIYLMAFFDTKDVGPDRHRRAAGRFRRLAQRQHRQRLADAARGRGAPRRRQGRGRQVPDPAARATPGRCPDGLYPAAVRHAIGGYALLRSNLKSHGDADVAAVDRLWQAGQGLSAVAGRQSAADGVHRRQGCPFDCTIRYDAELLRRARPHRAERALARARPGDDRSAQVARHREGQALQPGRANQAICSNAASREAKAWLEASTTPASRPSGRAAAGPFRPRPSSSSAAQAGLRRPRQLPDRRCAAWPTPTPISASSAWAPASST